MNRTERENLLHRKLAALRELGLEVEWGRDFGSLGLVLRASRRVSGLPVVGDTYVIDELQVTSTTDEGWLAVLAEVTRRFTLLFHPGLAARGAPS